jgi:nicotinamide-nucleotide amidase
LQRIVGEFIVGENDDSLASVVVELLQKRQQQITVAESCTGGMIASQITGVSGVSSVFEAGFITYSNAIKQQILGVDSDLIEQYGSVSEDVVRAMALGALDSASADCVIAVSGIAGPKGGTAEKPVGTVWIAWGSRENLQAKRFNYPVGRQFFQTMISALALDLVRRFLLGSTSLPDYFQRKLR